MNATKLSPDDPRITAYALGELEGADREAVESALRTDTSLRAMVDEIRLTGDRVEAALAREAAQAIPTETKVVELFPFQKGPVVRQPEAAEVVAAEPARDPYGRGARKSIAAYSQFYYIVGGVAAACFAVAVYFTPQRPQATPVAAKVYLQMMPVEPASKAADPEKSPATTPATKGTLASGDSATPATTEASKAAGVEPTPSTPAKTDIPTLVVVNKDQPAPAVDPVAPATESDAVPASISMAPALNLTTNVSPEAVPARPNTGSGDKMYIAPFTISADRLQKRMAAQNPAPAASAAEPTPGDIVRLDAFTVNETKADPAGSLGLEPSRLIPASTPRTRESSGYLPESEFTRARQHPFSTFVVDTETASYASLRSYLLAKQRPPLDAVRIEEMLNYFPYHYPPPSAKSEAPLAAALEVSEAPWAPGHRLVRIGLKAREVTTAERAAANLVFLIDVSGSMGAANRLPLVQESMRMLVGKLRPDDRVAIVTYAGNSGLALPSTLVAESGRILRSLEKLRPGAPANGSTGIQLAYDIARANFVADGINRVILCTDGDFKVGVSGEDELMRLIQDKAQTGVYLTVLGYGMGVAKDSKLELLASKGNGHYAYINSRKEAEKTLVQEVNGTLVTVAKDVKIQVEFNPAQVASYRLIGYENRALKKEDFANDKVDAGEVGAGHTVTALYEVIPARTLARAKNDPDFQESRYNYYGGVADYVPKPGDARGRELLTVKVRYKKPDGFLSRQLDFPLTDGGGKFASATPDFKFAAAVAGFGMILRDSPHKGSATMANVIEWAQAGLDDDVGHYRSDFIELARLADSPDK